MLTAAKIRLHYAFEEEDARRLAACRPFMEQARDQVVAEFYRFIVGTPEIAPLIAELPERERKHRLALGWWFLELFRGEYDDRYFSNLERIGRTHVRIGLSGHYVNAGMNLLRTLGASIIRRNVADAAEAEATVASYDRILDMNLDVMTSSYREAELRHVLLSHKVDDILLRSAERFSSGLKLVLVAALMAISLGVIAMFVSDAVHVVQERTAHSVLTALGSLLIIWVMVELIENEIRELRGGHFKIQVFLGVALVAFIREILIASLKHDEAAKAGYFLLAAILVIGVVYWLISRAEHTRRSGPAA